MLIAGAYQLDRPGLYGDEALQSALAARIAGQNLPWAGYPHGAEQVDLNGRVWPLMTMAYIGPVKTYLLAGAFALFSTSVITLRLTTLFVGLIALVFTYLFLRRAFGLLVAQVGALLLGTDMSFIMMTRLDWGPVAIALAAKAIGLYCLVRWWQSAISWRWPFLAGLAFGFGLSHKADFAWLLIAGLPVALVLYSRQIRARLAELVYAVAGLLIGSSPLLIYNLLSDWITWAAPRAELGKQLSASYPDLPSPLAMLQLAAQAVQHRWAIMMGVLRGTAIQNLTLADATMPLQDVKLQALALAAVVGLIALLLGGVGVTRLRRAAVAAVGVVLVIFAQILVTPSASGPHHSIAVYPFVQTAIALGLAALIHLPWARWRVALHGLAWAAVILIVGSNLIQLTSYHQRLAVVGGRGLWSNAIYEVANSLKTEYPTEVIHPWVGPARPADHAARPPGTSRIRGIRTRHRLQGNHIAE